MHMGGGGTKVDGGMAQEFGGATLALVGELIEEDTEGISRDTLETVVEAVTNGEAAFSGERAQEAGADDDCRRSTVGGDVVSVPGVGSCLIESCRCGCTLLVSNGLSSWYDRRGSGIVARSFAARPSSISASSASSPLIDSTVDDRLRSSMWNSNWPKADGTFRPCFGVMLAVNIVPRSPVPGEKFVH